MPTITSRTPPKAEVCVMPGRSRLACWGCPALTCAYNQQPFEDLAETLRTAMGAVIALETNRIFLMGARMGESVSGHQLLASLGDNPEGELLARLVEARSAFTRNLSIEGVVLGRLAPDEGATLARMRGTASAGYAPNSRQEFDRLVQETRERLEEPDPEPGTQRHSKKIGSQTDDVA